MRLNPKKNQSLFINVVTRRIPIINKVQILIIFILYSFKIIGCGFERITTNLETGHAIAVGIATVGAFEDKSIIVHVFLTVGAVHWLSPAV